MIPPLDYHAGQLAVQQEANTRPVAENLRDWVGPVPVFARAADLVVIAAPGDRDSVGFTVLSGPPPLVSATELGDDLVVAFPRALLDALAPGTPVSAIVINPAVARRSRVAGILTDAGDHAEVRCVAAMTHCRKYIAPTRSEATTLQIGPQGREAIALDHPDVAGIVARAETAFLATTTPDGRPDAAHRGGQPGFIRFDPASGDIVWPEFVGDGMFVNTGNLRATGRFALLALDLEQGRAVELRGRGDFTTLRTQREAREAALVHFAESFPVQGEVRGRIDDAVLLTGLFHPRRRLEERQRITSCSAVEEQAPQ